MRPTLTRGGATLPRRLAAAAVPALAVVALAVHDVLLATTPLGSRVVDAVTLAVLVLGAELLVGAPLRRLTRELTVVRVSGDLSVPIGVPRGPVAEAARAAAGLVESVHSVLTKVRFTSTLVADKARHVQDAASGVTSGSELQEDAVRTALVAVDRVLEAAEAVDGDARGAADLAGVSLEATRNGAGNMAAARQQMHDIGEAVASTVAAVDALGARVRSIDEMVAVVSGIAEQTNLLALNATIESARAGESGRGFAVVAHEVGQLAEHTTESTRQITEVVEGVRRDTEAVLRLVGRTASLAEQGAALTAAATTALGEIEAATQQTTASIGSIQHRASGQRDASRSLRGQVDQIEGLARANRDGAGEVHGQALGLDHLAENLREIENVFALGARGETALALHLRMPDVVVRAAADVAEALQRLVDQRRIGLEELFDEAYQPIPGTSPQKFHTRYDRLTDEVLPAIQEPLLDLDANIVYAGAVDRRGYFPTHNRRFSRPLTGDPATDLVGNRTKRIFDDPVGRRCGSHDLPFLVQTYRRDTGEVVHDISAPIVVAGRQWGGFRIGYRA